HRGTARPPPGGAGGPRCSGPAGPRARWAPKPPREEERPRAAPTRSLRSRPQYRQEESVGRVLTGVRAPDLDLSLGFPHLVVRLIEYRGPPHDETVAKPEIGRASCRERA